MIERPDDEAKPVTAGSGPDAESARDDLDDDSEDADQASPDDASRAPEEENESRIPGDPRAPNEQQPPFKEQD